MSPVTDPIGDLLTRMRNAQSTRHGDCTAPWSSLKERICELLKKEGWVSEVEVTGEGIEKQIEITFSAEHPSLTLKRVSKPGRRVYSSVSEIKPVLNGFGMAVVSTSQGLLTDTQAREKKIGGEVLCTIS